MMPIFLPNDFKHDDGIVKIFKKLAATVHGQLDGGSVSYTRNGEPLKLSTIEDIQKFMFAPDFYNYICDIKISSFILDIMNLPHNVYISAILNKSHTKSKQVLNFRKKHNTDESEEFYKKLQKLAADLTLSKQGKEKIVKDVFPEYKKFEQLCAAFSYEHLSDVDRHYIITKMDIPVCPYCNMNYTISYDFNGGKRTTADLDHFYLKSNYPMYALCLYNFIPSCQACNQRVKGSNDMDVSTHIFPHEECFGENSSFQIANIVEAIIGDEKALLTIKHVESNGKCRASDVIFRLSERYKELKAEATTLLEKSTIYNKTYKEELNSMINPSETIKQLVFGRIKTEEELGRESLGKMKQDVLKQLGIFKKGS